MTPNRIELIVQAVKENATTNYDGYIQIYETSLRHAIKSINNQQELIDECYKIKLREFSTTDVDNFLREHPEYRCLDVIGKIKNWKRESTLASIPEMPQVDEAVPVGYAKLIRRKNSMKNLTVGKTYPIQSTWSDLIIIIDDAGNIKSYTSGRNWIINLTSPPTKTE